MLKPLLIESYEGSDTHIKAEAFDDTGYTTQEELWVIVKVQDDGSLDIIDAGYRSREEALEAIGVQ